MNQVEQKPYCERFIPRGLGWPGQSFAHSWLDSLSPGLQVCYWCKQVCACPACWSGRHLPAGVRLVRCSRHSGN
jgi:hypothetical protein